MYPFSPARLVNSWKMGTLSWSSLCCWLQFINGLRSLLCLSTLTELKQAPDPTPPSSLSLPWAILSHQPSTLAPSLSLIPFTIAPPSTQLLKLQTKEPHPWFLSFYSRILSPIHPKLALPPKSILNLCTSLHLTCHFKHYHPSLLGCHSDSQVISSICFGCPVLDSPLWSESVL